MLKRINWKAIIISFVWLTSLSGLIVLMSFINAEQSQIVCKEMKIIIPDHYYFIDREEVERILLANGPAMVGRDLDHINIHQLEKKLKSNPFIEQARIYADIDGIVRVEIQQRQPILRIFNKNNADFYVDKDGFKIPTSALYTARVLPANGYIPEPYPRHVDSLNTKLAKDLFRTADFIRRDTLWDAQIDQLYVNAEGEIELVPRVGNHKIILGNADSVELKFRNLLIFYKKALPKVGWDTYKTMNIKYTNQILAEKANADTTKVPAPAIQPDSVKINTVQDSI